MKKENEADLEHEALESSSGHSHGQFHAHVHANPEASGEMPASILTIRSHSGVSGDMLLTGFALLNLHRLGIQPDGPEGDAWLASLLNHILPRLGQHVKIRAATVGGVRGWRARIDLPREHGHRGLEDIKAIIASSGMSEAGSALAVSCFELLAECEAVAHGLDVSEIHFHEVGALDSILDICGVCELYALLDPVQLVCGPLPIADGRVSCAHGVLPAPAPATLRLLHDIPVRPFEGSIEAGELITPTGIALLRTLKAGYGPWPAFRMEHAVLVYGQKVFQDAPNGLIIAAGSRY